MILYLDWILLLSHWSGPVLPEHCICSALVVQSMLQLPTREESVSFYWDHKFIVFMSATTGGGNMGPFIATSLYYYLLELDGQPILIYSKNELKSPNHISFLFPGWLALQPMVPLDWTISQPTTTNTWRLQCFVFPGNVAVVWLRCTLNVSKEKEVLYWCGTHHWRVSHLFLTLFIKLHFLPVHFTCDYRFIFIGFPLTCNAFNSNI